MEYSIATLKHSETGLYHVCYLTLAPFPGGPDKQKDMPRRWRSRAHHTDGVATEEEAKTEMEQLVHHLKRDGEPQVDFGIVEWDGTIGFMMLSKPRDEKSINKGQDDKEEKEEKDE